MPSTAASDARLCRYSGSHCWRMTCPSIQPPAAPKALPQRITPAKVIRLWLRPLPAALAMMKLYTTTASRAPMGSMTMPSQRRMLAIADFGRTTRSMGTITVGPVTRVRVPNKVASIQSKSSSQWVARVMMSQVDSAPRVTIRRTTVPISRHCDRCRVRLPSNRISATASDTRGISSGPNIACGSSQPRIGPARMPLSRRKRMAGSFRRQASHWQARAAPPMPPKVSNICCSLIPIPYAVRVVED
ncbi:hypothetical protein D3C76_912650 [compost metagenome]